MNSWLLDIILHISYHYPAKYKRLHDSLQINKPVITQQFCSSYFAQLFQSNYHQVHNAIYENRANNFTRNDPGRKHMHCNTERTFGTSTYNKKNENQHQTVALGNRCSIRNRKLISICIYNTLIYNLHNFHCSSRLHAKP